MITAKQQLTRRGLPGVVDPGFVADPETRRVLESLKWRIQWIIDNWPISKSELQYLYSVIRKSDNILLANDEKNPTGNKYYGTNSVGKKGWHDLPETNIDDKKTGGGGPSVALIENHSFRLVKGVPNSIGTYTPGRCYIEGTLTTITDQPTATITAGAGSGTTYYWVRVNTSAATATWESGTSLGTALTNEIIYPILEATRVAGLFTTIVERRMSDIIVSASASDVNHPFKFTLTSATGGDLTTGKLAIDGVDTTITDLPTSLSSVTSSVKYWIAVDLSGSTAAWTSGAAFPEGDATTEIIPVLEIVCTDSVITSFVQHQFQDVWLRLIPASVPDGTVLGEILHWDTVTSAWVVSVVGALAADDMLKWDATNSKWVKVTPTTQTVVSDVQYDSTNHVVQKKTISLTIVAKGSESAWTTITGGTAVPET